MSDRRQVHEGWIRSVELRPGVRVYRAWDLESWELEPLREAWARDRERWVYSLREVADRYGLSKRELRQMLRTRPGILVCRWCKEDVGFALGRQATLWTTCAGCSRGVW